KPAGTWTCYTCMIENNVEKTKCAACETPKPSSKPIGILSSLFAKKAGSWDCDVCMVQNNPDVEKCAACETPKP
ncbi:hypothetical protein LOTGIDRAFT_80233, partial [Lottia gigantea]